MGVRGGVSGAARRGGSSVLAPRTVRRAPLARERNFCSDLKSQLLCLFISPAAVAGCQARRPCLLKTHFSCPARSSSLLAALRCSVEIKRCKVCSGVPGGVGWGGWVVLCVCVCGDGGGGGAVPASRVPPGAGAVSRVPSRLSPLPPRPPPCPGIAAGRGDRPGSPAKPFPALRSRGPSPAAKR